MEIKNEKPPAKIWDRALRLFSIDTDNVMFSYDGVLYNPANRPVDQFLMIHEATHMKQQEDTEGGCDAWWEKYFTDAPFRAEQEVQAYGAQYRLYCRIRKDRNYRAKYLHAIAAGLSSGMYALTMPYNDAVAAVRKRAGI